LQKTKGGKYQFETRGAKAKGQAKRIEQHGLRETTTSNKSNKTKQ
jgi:hypothetical protein